jgi:hypothetical protein
MNYKYFIFAVVIVILMSVVRWNRQDLIIGKYVGADDKNLGQKLGYDVQMSLDSYNYVQYVNYYNGEDVADEITKPYTYRFFIPFIASLLPFDSFTSLNLINLSSEILTVLFLMYIFAAMGFSEKIQLAGAILFAFSFPVFYYGVVGLLDAPAILIITIGIYLVLKNKYILLLLLLAFGAMINEKTILLLPFFFAFKLKDKSFKTSLIQSAIMGIIFITVNLVARKLTINADSQFIWTVSMDSLIYNLGRIRTYISLILTGGIPLLLLLFSLQKFDKYDKLNFALFVGVIMVALMIVYSLTAAYTDGRFMWYIYPFALPLCGYGLQKILDK